MFSIGNKTYELVPGDLFIICPGMEHYYQADVNNPYEYYWIGFHGLEAKRILQEIQMLNGDYVIHPSHNLEYLFKEFRNLKDRTKKSKYLALSKLYEIFSVISEDNEIKNEDESTNKDILSQVMKYIQNNYSKPLKVEEMAKKFGISRSNLYRLFKDQMNLSVSEYILNVRLTEACLLLKNPLLRNYQVVEQCGFSDYNNFLKTFKKKYGITPRHYRKDPFETTK